MMTDLPVLFESFGVKEEYPSDEELQSMAMQCEDIFFTGEMIPPYEKKDIIHILEFYAQYEYAPKFYAFQDIDRNRIDVSVIAKEVYERKLSRLEEAEYLNSLWESADDNLLRLFFGRKNTFLEMFDIEMRKLVYKGVYEEDNVKIGIREYADMSLYEIRKYNPDYEKGLRDSVFAAAKDMHGNYVCANCGKRSRSQIIFQVDHIKPLNKGGKTVLENLQLLCRFCNRKKSDF